MSEKPTNKVSEAAVDEMRPEYDLRGGVRGKYYERFRRESNIVVLDDDIADAFKGSEAVNAALRQYIAEHGAPSK